MNGSTLGGGGASFLKRTVVVEPQIPNEKDEELHHESILLEEPLSDDNPANGSKASPIIVNK